MKTKRLVGMAVVAAVLLAIPLAQMVFANPPKGNMIKICHYPGHGDGKITDHPIGLKDMCEARGGAVLWVNVQGACNGHGIRLGICQDDSCYPNACKEGTYCCNGTCIPKDKICPK